MLKCTIIFLILISSQVYAISYDSSDATDRKRATLSAELDSGERDFLINILRKEITASKNQIYMISLFGTALNISLAPLIINQFTYNSYPVIFWGGIGLVGLELLVFSIPFFTPLLEEVILRKIERREIELTAGLKTIADNFKAWRLTIGWILTIFAGSASPALLSHYYSTYTVQYEWVVLAGISFAGLCYGLYSLLTPGPYENLYQYVLDRRKKALSLNYWLSPSPRWDGLQFTISSSF